MIIWSGYGFVVFVIALIDSLIAELITKSISNDENFYQNNLIPLGCSFLVSALIIKALSNYFEQKKKEGKGTRIFDRITIAKESHLFFIPFVYWFYILGAIGILLIIAQLRK